MQFHVLRSASALDASTKTGDEPAIQQSRQALNHAEVDDNTSAHMTHSAVAQHHLRALNNITDPSKRELHAEAFRAHSDAATHHRLAAEETRDQEEATKEPENANIDRADELKSTDEGIMATPAELRAEREARYAPYLQKTNKGLNTTYAGSMQPDSVVADEEDIFSPNDLAGKDEPSAGIRALLNTAQFLMDGCDALEQDAQQSDSPELRAYAQQVIMEMKAIAEQCTEKAEYVKSKLDNDGGDMDENEDEEDKEDNNEKEESEELDKANENDDGTTGKKKKEKKSVLDRDDYGFIICKSYPEWRPRRFTRANLKDIEVAEQDSLQKEYRAEMERLSTLQSQAKALLSIPKKR